MILNFAFDLPCRISPDNVPEVLLMAGFDFLSYKICRYIPKEDSLT